MAYSLLTFPALGLTIAAAANVTEAGVVYPFALQIARAFSRRDSQYETSRAAIFLSSLTHSLTRTIIIINP